MPGEGPYLWFYQQKYSAEIDAGWRTVNEGAVPYPGFEPGGKGGGGERPDYPSGLNLQPHDHESDHLEFNIRASNSFETAILLESYRDQIYWANDHIRWNPSDYNINQYLNLRGEHRVGNELLNPFEPNPFRLGPVYADDPGMLSGGPLDPTSSDPAWDEPNPADHPSPAPPPPAPQPNETPGPHTPNIAPFQVGDIGTYAGTDLNPLSRRVRYSRNPILFINGWLYDPNIPQSDFSGNISIDPLYMPFHWIPRPRPYHNFFFGGVFYSTDPYWMIGENTPIEGPGLPAAGTWYPPNWDPHRGGGGGSGGGGSGGEGYGGGGNQKWRPVAYGGEVGIEPFWYRPGGGRYPSPRGPKF